MSRQELAYTGAAVMAVACAVAAAVCVWVLLNPAVLSLSLAGTNESGPMPRLISRLVAALAGWLIALG